MRACRGASITSSGVPTSTTSPSAMNTTRSATSRRELHLVRDDEHRHACVGQAPHRREDLHAELGVERRRRLVEQHHLRVERERPRDRDPLLLAAGAGARVLVGRSARPTCSSSAPRALLGLLARAAERVDLREHHVLRRACRCGKRLKLLEDHPDARGDGPRGPRCRPARPRTAMRPSVGAWRWLTQRSSVLLPAPLGPISAMTSPGATSSETSRTTSMPPSRTQMPCSWTIGARFAGDSPPSLKAGPTVGSDGLVLIVDDGRRAFHTFFASADAAFAAVTPQMLSRSIDRM